MASDSQDVDHNAAVSHVAVVSFPRFSRPNATSPPSSRRNSARSSKRRRSSIMLLSPPFEHGSGSAAEAAAAEESLKQQFHDAIDNPSDQEEIAISSTNKIAGKAIAPFLAKHIPNTYNPMGQQLTAVAAAAAEPAPASNTKYCNRHRPDRKCRRQADGPSMEQLQNELSSLSHSDRSAISHVWSVFSAAPGKQRELILQGILSVACFNQLSFISAQVRDLIKIDFISLLPTEISLQILTKLDTLSLCNSAQVCRKWRQLSDDDVVWHRLCEQHLGSRCRKCGWGLPLLDRQRLRQEKRQIQLRAIGAAPEDSPLEKEVPSDTGRDTPELVGQSSAGQKRQRTNDAVDADPSQKRLCTTPSVDGGETLLTRRPWKDVYKARFKVGSNWKHNRHRLQTIKAHSNGVTCLQLGQNILGDHVIASGSYDCSVKLHDVETGQVLKTFEGATQGIRCLQFNQRQLISGSLDGKVRLYDIETGQLKKTLEGPTRGILSVHSDGQWLCAGSMDKNIYVWDASTRRTTLLRGHTDFVNSVWLDRASRTLFSASDDCFICLWDLDTRRIIKRFEGHVGPVQQVIPMPPEFKMDEADLADLQHEYDTDTDLENEPSGSTPPPSLTNTPIFPEDPNRPNPTPQYILSAGLDATIRLWHVPSGRCLRTFFGHLEGIWALAADTLRIVSTSEDGMVKIWCPNSGSCERTYTGHQGPVTCVSLSGERLITGGEDCEIRIMNFSEDVGSDTGAAVRKNGKPT